MEILYERLIDPVFVSTIIDLPQRFREGKAARTSMFGGRLYFFEELVELHICPCQIGGFVANPSRNGCVNLGQQEFDQGHGAWDGDNHASNPSCFLYSE